MYPQDQGRLHSMFKAQEDEELDLGFLMKAQVKYDALTPRPVLILQY